MSGKVEKPKTQTVIVTGASKGIGAGIARHFGTQGSRVVVNYSRDFAGAQRVVDEIARQGGKAIAVQADLSRPDEASRLVELSVEAFGAEGALNLIMEPIENYCLGPV